jgi:hypothetical protein
MSQQLHVLAIDVGHHQVVQHEYLSVSYTVEPWIVSNLVCECFTRRAKILKEF